MSVRTVITHAQIQGEESGYAQSQRASGALTIAPLGAMCGRCPSRGEGRRVAVHALRGRYLCAFHSPYDVTDADRVALAARGVSLGKPGDPVTPSVPAPTGPIREKGDGWVSYVPRGEWAGLITAALRHSQYAYASALSEQFHAPETA